MNYYAFIDGEQQGPFELQQLIEAGVRPSTYVWCKGMADWQRADEVPDICRLLRQHLADKMHSSKLKNQEIINPGSNSLNGNNPAISTEQEISENQKPVRLPVGSYHVTEPEPDYDSPPQVSTALAIFSLIFFLPALPAGIAAIVFAYKAQNTWKRAAYSESKEDADHLKRQAHEFARLAKMWLGLTIALGVILWTLIFSIK